MIVLRAIWFVVSLPFRAVFWLLWQVRRGAYAAVAAMQRRIGQRNAILVFAAILGLFGLGLLTGVIDCKPTSRCIDGWEVPQGIFFAGFAAFLAYIAVRNVPNTREATVTPKHDYMEYDSEDWKLSWASVGLVAGLVAVFAFAIWLVAVTR